MLILILKYFHPTSQKKYLLFDKGTIIIIIILLKFKFNRFLNLHSPHIASLIEAGCVTYNKIHNKHIALQIHYIIIKFRKKNIYKYHYQNQVNK